MCTTFTALVEESNVVKNKSELKHNISWQRMDFAYFGSVNRCRYVSLADHDFCQTGSITYSLGKSIKITL
jgi:hypothetical protein